jgi:hypothetical protein
MVQVRIFSGLGSSIVPYFSRGTRRIEKLISESPQQTQVSHHIWSSWRGVCKTLINNFQQEKIGGPIILIGHSNGVLACCNIARRLAELDVPVAYIAAIDPTPILFPRIKNNVFRVDEFWGTSGVSHIARRMSYHKLASCKFTDEWAGKHGLYIHHARHVEVSYLTDVLLRIGGSVQFILDAESLDESYHYRNQRSPEIE